MPHTQIVQSVFDFEMREINAMERHIVATEDDTDATLWAQAEKVVAQLDAGMTQRQLAAQWINLRTGEPYSQMHVSFVARLVREKLTFQLRPRFREAYSDLANNGSGKINRLLHQTGAYEWYSPPLIVSAVHDVFGAIDLDPASCEVANTVVQAAQIYTVAENGLEQPWHGRVYLNPPYRQPEINQWCEKFAHHAKARDIEGIVLVNNATDTAWFDTLAAVAVAYCFPKFRCRYWQPDQETSTALQGQVLVYAGSDRDAFCRRFAELGHVVVPHVW